MSGSVLCELCVLCGKTVWHHGGVAIAPAISFANFSASAAVIFKPGPIGRVARSARSQRPDRTAKRSTLNAYLSTLKYRHGRLLHLSVKR